MNDFTLYPAIDLRNGEVVRLKQGDPAQQTTYGNDPRAAAHRWIECRCTMAACRQPGWGLWRKLRAQPGGSFGNC